MVDKTLRGTIGMQGFLKRTICHMHAPIQHDISYIFFS